MVVVRLLYVVWLVGRVDRHIQHERIAVGCMPVDVTCGLVAKSVGKIAPPVRIVGAVVSLRLPLGLIVLSVLINTVIIVRIGAIAPIRPTAAIKAEILI